MQPFNHPTIRHRLALRGAVQGVGFRPFVYRLATELGLKGWVNNSAQGVFIEIEGQDTHVSHFIRRLQSEKPARSSIQSLEQTQLDPVGYRDFQIRPSDSAGDKTALVLPDIATCPDCLREIFDPANRRFRYPFTNCTNCGPRYSIIQALPYDRTNTSMRGFAMCPLCQAEYSDPLDRRFHAQPNACPACGPQLELCDRSGNTVATQDAALIAAAKALQNGRIVAIKGIGGFHLMVAANDDSAVQRLRQLKHREEKPFALMFPDLEQVKDVCELDESEERLLRAPEAPILLLRKKASANLESLAPSVAPGNPTLGVMLPYSPLHHLLMAELRVPVVATSGNLSDEPICIDEQDALKQLGGIADFFLVHNRPIVRHVDDSIVRIMLGRELVLRRARGFAPLPITLKESHRTVLAVGAHLKNSIALSVGPHVFISQHIGDLETEAAMDAFRRVIHDFENLYQATPTTVAADLHPDYLSTRFAHELGKPVIPVQHHLAHVFSCMGENEVAPPALGVAWDGTGFGTDHTVWGGEAFQVTEHSIKRVAWLRPFPLPGGEKAVKEPRRVALGLLYELFGPSAFEHEELPSLKAFSAAERAALKTALARKINAPVTSSVGRLFDALASLIGLRQLIRFEGQAAMELEFLLDRNADTESPYRFEIRTGADGLLLDWEPMITSVLADLQSGTAIGRISARFHNALAESIVDLAKRTGEKKVLLSGGCFQNRYLTERTVLRLREEGFHPYWHQRVPPNDGGIALGQIIAALREKD